MFPEESMLEIDIPGFGPVRLEHLVSDFTGTLSVDGMLLPRVGARLNKLSEVLKVHVLTADTFGKAREELHAVACDIHILSGEDHDVQKEEYVAGLGAGTVVAWKREERPEDAQGSPDRHCRQRGRGMRR